MHIINAIYSAEVSLENDFLLHLKTYSKENIFNKEVVYLQNSNLTAYKV